MSGKPDGFASVMPPGECGMARYWREGDLWFGTWVRIEHGEDEASCLDRLRSYSGQPALRPYFTGTHTEAVCARDMAVA